MRNVASDPTKALEHFEPGSEADEFVRACTVAAGQLMRLLQGQQGHPDSLSERIDQLEKRLELLQDTLENTIRVASSVLETLKRLETEGDG